MSDNWQEFYSILPEFAQHLSLSLSLSLPRLKSLVGITGWPLSWPNPWLPLIKYQDHSDGLDCRRLIILQLFTLASHYLVIVNVVNLWHFLPLSLHI